MDKFRKKPVVIEAIQWTGENSDECLDFADSGEYPVWGADFMVNTNQKIIYITTLEGVMTASVGDWIIRGVKGELYPCKPDIFEATYEPV